MRLLKYKEMYTNTPMLMNFGAFGEVKLVLRDLNGRFLKETPWHKNMILDQGMLLMGTVGYRSSRHFLGDSSIPETTTQTGIQGTFLSMSDYILTGQSPSANSGSPDYIWSRIIANRHNAGFTGTVREITTSYTSAYPTGQSNRIVVPDFPVNIDQIVDSYYKMSGVPDLTDTVGQVTIDSILYDYTMRLYNVDYLHSSLTDPWDRWGGSTSATAMATANGPLGSLTSVGPSGIVQIGGTYSAIQAISGRADWRVYFGINVGNFDLTGGGGLRSMRTKFQGPNIETGIQVQFDNAADGSAIPKDGDREIYFDLGMTWTRT